MKLKLYFCFICSSCTILFWPLWFEYYLTRREGKKLKVNTNSTAKYPWCSWCNGVYRYDYDHSRRSSCVQLIKILNQLDMTYFLAFGTGIGQVRNGGIVPEDNDIDIVVPIWLNDHIFHCSIYKPINMSHYGWESVIMSQNYTLCGHKRQYYHRILLRRLRYKLNLPLITHMLESFTSNIHLNIFPELLIDFWPFLTNEYTFRTIEPCWCTYCGEKALSTETMPSDLQKLYGNYDEPAHVKPDWGREIESPD